MGKTKATSKFLDIGGAISDDELFSDDQPSDISLKMPPKKRGAAAAKATTKPAAASKVTKPKAKTAPAGKAARTKLAAAIENTDEGREALSDKTNAGNAPPAKRGRKAKAVEEVEEESPLPATTKPARGRPARGARTAEVEVPDSTAKPAPAKRGRKPAAAAAAKKVVVEEPEHDDTTEIPETQQPEPEAMHFDISIMESSAVADFTEDVSMEAEPAPVAARRRAVPPPSAQRAPSLSPMKLGNRVVKRTGSSDGESDPSVRRRLGDLTKKYEALETRYQDLREIGIKEAERNYDKLKKQGEEKTKSSNDLIASLKADLAAQKELAREGAQAKTQWAASEAKVDTLQARITELTTALSEAKSENKTLSTKLSAARAAEASAAVKVPGSALKAGSSAARAAEAVHATAQKKEDLYGDLTGLIVQGIKKDGDQDVYNCIQTGRNGTLHFKLAVGISPAASAADNSYEEAEFMYKPQLDPSRDAALIDILPDYLVEEITFPRPHAAKFYARVMRSLTDRPE